MTYQIAYNPALNNALVGVAETIGDVPEGITVETHDGDIPDMGIINADRMTEVLQ